MFRTTNIQLMKYSRGGALPSFDRASSRRRIFKKRSSENLLSCLHTAHPVNSSSPIKLVSLAQI
jgi:hypothetical protein